MRRKIEEILLRDRRSGKYIDIVHLDNDAQEIMDLFKKKMLKAVPKEEEYIDPEKLTWVDGYNVCIREIKNNIEKIK